MVTLGRWFEATGKQKATEALDQLLALLPSMSRRQMVDGVVDVPSVEIQTGDCLIIRPGERFPTDAVIELGQTTVDEQVFTGESTPVGRIAGDQVLAGTVNLDGQVTVSATAPFRGGSFGRLLSLFQQARLSRGHYQRLADRDHGGSRLAQSCRRCRTVDCQQPSGDFKLAATDEQRIGGSGDGDASRCA